MLLVRHGESEFNKAFKKNKVDPGIPDPALTPLGLKQMRRSGKYLKAGSVTKLFSSPYRRALESCTILNQHLNLTIVISSLIREQFGFSCDIGSTSDKLQEAWPLIDFADLPCTWWPDSPESDEDVKKRTLVFIEDVKTSPDFDSTLVVCHWGVIRALTGLSVGNGAIVKIPKSGEPSVVYSPDV